MATDTIAIARIRLARELMRLLALPLLLLLLAAAAAGAAVLLEGAARLALLAAAGIVAIVAGVLAAAPLSLRLDVEVGGLRVRWLGGSQRYLLVRGPVTRVGLTGPAAGIIRSRHPILGWSNGPATFRGEEHVTLVRLARTATVILIPTDRGRLAVAAASEAELVDALGAAARVQQRLDEVGGRVQAALPGGIADHEERARRAAAHAAEVAATAEAERVLTGIERARMEERLAAAREAALLAAEAERAASLAQAPEGGEPPQDTRARVVSQAEEEPPWTAPSAARERRAGTWSRPAWATDARLRLLATIGWAGLPLVASLAVWAVASSSSAITSPRTLSLALSLGGPAAALAVLLARAWWPRLTGLVTVSAVAAMVLVARAAIT